MSSIYNSAEQGPVIFLKLRRWKFCDRPDVLFQEKVVPIMENVPSPNFFLLFVRKVTPGVVLETVLSDCTGGDAVSVSVYDWLIHLILNVSKKSG